MNLLKILSILVVFVEIGLFGYLPYIWRNVGQNKRIMSIVGCFAGGLFLALAFLHILPEANDDLNSYFTKRTREDKFRHLRQPIAASGTSSTLSWGNLIAILTFVAVLSIESFVHKYLDEKERQLVQSKKYDEQLFLNTDNVDQHEHHHQHHHQHHHSTAYLSSGSSSVLLTQLALSIHAFIECLALGSQQTDKATLTLLVGIGCHKWAQGLTLGFEYKRANFTPQMALNFCLVHAFLNAGAVLLGWIFSQSGQLLSGILGAISAGTFLYVSTIQKVQSQFSNSQRLPQKIIMMLVGIGFVCLIV